MLRNLGSNNQQTFFALLRAGLRESEVTLSTYGEIDFKEVYRLAQEQAVVGVVAAGLEHVTDIKIPQEIALTFAGEALQLEQRNKAMNRFISDVIEELRNAEIYTLLVKGQGIAQCYERPLWRSSGDIDLLLSKDNYNRAIRFLSPKASSIEKVESYKNHQPMIIGGWEVELHGTLRGGLWKKIDKTLDEVQNDVFYGGNVRTWMNGNTQVFIPRADEDVIFVFSHMLQHFYKEGVGLRQVCDWLRLLWIYSDIIDINLLESRLRHMGVMAEWNAFSDLAVNSLGMPLESMPFYTNRKNSNGNAEKLCSFILKVGNFGHNKVRKAVNHTLFIRKWITARDMINNSLRHIALFPYNSIRTCFYQVWLGFLSQFNRSTNG